MLRTLLIYLLAGLAEIGGGYLIWQWLRAGKPLWFGVLGAIVLISYGIIATWQPAGFAKVYATYGGIFILLSLVWCYWFDGYIPTLRVIIGACLILIGVLVMISDHDTGP